MTPSRTGSPIWETAWAAHFLRPRQVHLLSANLVALSSPCAEWTIVRRDDPDSAVAAAGPPVVLDDTYELIQLRQPQGTLFTGTMRIDTTAPPKFAAPIVSAGPDLGPDALILRRLGEDKAEFVFQQAGVDVVRSAILPIKTGRDYMIDIALGKDSQIRVTLDGETVVSNTLAFATIFGRGVLVGSTGAATPLPPFPGRLSLRSSDPILCAAS